MNLPDLTGRERTFETQCKVLSLNEARRLHYHAWGSYVSAIRQDFGWLGTQARRQTGYDRVVVEVAQLHRKGKAPQDVGACAVAAKAAVDGLVDGGVFPDDNPAHVIAVLFTTPEPAPASGLRLTISEVAPA